MRTVAVGLLVEEHRGEIAATWRTMLERELGGEPAIGFAVGPLLREMALALRLEAPSGPRVPREEGLQRCAVLVRSTAHAPRVAREFKLLRRALWDVLRASGRIVAADERRAVDEWLDEGLATSLDRLERVRARVDLLDRPAPVITSTRPAMTPPPLPRARTTPPRLPLPSELSGFAGHE